MHTHVPVGSTPEISDRGSMGSTTTRHLCSEGDMQETWGEGVEERGSWEDRGGNRGGNREGDICDTPFEMSSGIS